MKCPRCGTINRDDRKYCEVCGYNFVRKRDQLKRANLIGNLALTEAKVCKHCGWTNPPENIFCEKCGGELESIPKSVNWKATKMITGQGEVTIESNGIDKAQSYATVVISFGIIASYILGIITGKIL